MRGRLARSSAWSTLAQRARASVRPSVRMRANEGRSVAARCPARMAHLTPPTRPPPPCAAGSGAVAVSWVSRGGGGVRGALDHVAGSRPVGPRVACRRAAPAPAASCVCSWAAAAPGDAGCARARLHGPAAPAAAQLPGGGGRRGHAGGAHDGRLRRGGGGGSGCPGATGVVLGSCLAGGAGHRGVGCAARRPAAGVGGCGFWRARACGGGRCGSAPHRACRPLVRHVIRKTWSGRRRGARASRGTARPAAAH